MEHLNQDTRGDTGVTGEQQASGVLEAWLDGGIDTAESMVTTVVEILDEGRTQITNRVSHTIDWAEGFPGAMFSFARKLNHGTDRVAAQSIRYGDRFARSLLHAFRRAETGARGLASETASSIVGNGSKAVTGGNARAL